MSRTVNEPRPPVERLQNVRDILLLNRLHIGDCILTTPLLSALKRRFPAARLTLAVPAGNRALIRANPHVDEIIERPPTDRWVAKLRFILEVRRRRFDLIIAAQEKSVFYGWVAATQRWLNPRRPVTLSLSHPRTRRFYEFAAPMIADQHEVLKYLNLADALGCPRDPNPVLEFTPPRSVRLKVQTLLNRTLGDESARIIALNPGATTADKRWTTAGFAEVGDRLGREYGLPVVIIGGPGDTLRADEIRSMMKTAATSTAGLLDLDETAALLERAEVLVTGDTGPMHLAVAVATPVVAMFGPSSPGKFGPFTRNAVVIRHARPCSDCQRPCLHTILPEEVCEAVARLLGPPRRVEDLV